MTTVPIESIEIYPNIRVYKNMFKDISKSYKVLTDSLTVSEDTIFNNWTRWSHFGEYLNPITPSFSENDKYGNFNQIVAKTQKQQDEKDFALELMKNFYLVTEDYAARYGIDIDLSEISTEDSGNPLPTWRWAGGTIGKYDISDKDKTFGMNYHSDYIRERGSAPGYKFVITCTVYFNDDYEGGEVDFAMGDKLVKYKPEAGDLLVFPSGHPDFLTEEGKPYLHGVMPSYNNHKFLARMYWQRYQKGTDEWYENEQKFGKNVWAEMQKDLEEEFRLKHPQRNHIENGVRLL